MKSFKDAIAIFESAITDCEAANKGKFSKNHSFSWLTLSSREKCEKLKGEVEKLKAEAAKEEKHAQPTQKFVYKLINIANQPEYNTGSEFPGILQKCILKVFGISQQFQETFTQMFLKSSPKFGNKPYLQHVAEKFPLALCIDSSKNEDGKMVLLMADAANKATVLAESLTKLLPYLPPSENG